MSDVEMDNEESAAHSSLLASLGLGPRVDDVGPGRASVESSSLLASAAASLRDLGGLRHQLDVAHRRAPVLPAPLHKAAANRLGRATAYASVGKELRKWDGLVRANRAAEQLSFPLDQEREPLKTVAAARKDGLTPRTRLEKEMAAALADSRHALPHDVQYTVAEKEILKAMSLKEAERRTSELQKLRALQSFQEEKWRRQKKIKSKAYHRLRKRGERKRLLAELEELRSSDPAAAAERLEILERDRILERGTLKHRGTGQWAKALRLHARHDPATKDALQAHLRYGRELAEKRDEGDESGDDDAEAAEAPEPSDAVGRLEKLLDEAEEDFEPASFKGKDNPWMRSSLRALRSGDKAAPALPAAADVVEESEGDVEEIPEEILLDEPPKKEGKKAKKTKLYQPPVVDLEGQSDAAEPTPKKKKKKRKATVGDIDGLFEGLESRLIASAKADAGEANKGPPKPDAEEEVGLRSLQDTVAEARRARKKAAKAAPKKTEAEPSAEEALLADPQHFLKLATTLEGTDLGALIDGPEGQEPSQERLLAEAFADDDVTADFAAEKGRVEADEKPKAVSLALPGWGDWTGPDTKLSRRKKARFTVKPKEAGPRKDRLLPGVIISQKEDESIRKHQVKALPFPFTCVEDWEASVRHPVGREWNTGLAHAALTQPPVKTLRGRRIKPMDRDATFNTIGESGDQSDDSLK